mmetsp:Transcript_12289/g.12363  ORF Transcript_12289/g.12363 Transcript_12289/m.12363 type:complete len:99 (+) Transcript_12289:122-418(+)
MPIEIQTDTKFRQIGMCVSALGDCWAEQTKIQTNYFTNQKGNYIFENGTSLEGNNESGDQKAPQTRNVNMSEVPWYFQTMRTLQNESAIPSGSMAVRK